MRIEFVDCSSGEAAAVLTRPRFRVISSTKWEVNITRKYRVASSAMVPKIVGILSPGVVHRVAKKIVSENASRSGVSIVPAGSVPYGLSSWEKSRTIEKGDARICNLYGSMPDKETQAVCVEGDRWERLGLCNKAGMCRE